MDIEKLRFPIGEYQAPQTISANHLEEWKKIIKQFPNKLRESVENLSYDQLEWHYRPQGWSIRQVVHHLADSHMNAIIRFKLALTEDTPTIRPYKEASWARLEDGYSTKISESLKIVEGLHARWTVLLNNMSDKDFERRLIHPEMEQEISLDWMLGLYAWHSSHHLAHIDQALEHEDVFG